MAHGSSNPVQVTRSRVAIPTYEVGEPDRNPMFLEKRVYQGSSGAVYPHPVVEQIGREKRDVEWDAVTIENEYLKIMVLPELGGRVQMAYDKTNDYHFVYHNRVIKPALVGLAGPWISGGIEFNWPQHHRPNTYGPVDCDVERHDDGSVTVWCHEIDRMKGTRGTHGLRLRPGKAYLEIDVRLHNRTRSPQTFLWWANPACAVDENHQSMFPPDVHAVMDHGKRDVSSFPIATGEYYKVDYSPGTDISRYRNLPVPTSYMAYHSNYNYVGSYDWGRQAGLLHVANRHVSPGKKQWTWGHGDFGRAWDRHLTDEDGPYIELMCGVYTDNQPDFTWLAPGEQKSFTQYFMPYKGVGRLGNATVDACVGIDVADGVATVRCYVTAERPKAVIELIKHDAGGKETVARHTFDGSPRRHETFEATVGAAAAEAFEVRVLDGSGRELVSYRPSADMAEPIPEPARAIGKPEELDSCESLYLAATHLEQYRHATRDPEPYYREALLRDPGDSRCNVALARLLTSRGQPELAEPLCRAAIERLTRHNPNPVTGEAHLQLGLTLVLLGRDDEAEAPLWKACWDEACRSAASFELARLEMRRLANGRGDVARAIELLETCLAHNTHHHQAAHLLVALLFQHGREERAQWLASTAIGRDPFAFGVLWELASRKLESWDVYDRRCRHDPETAVQIALDYAGAGLDEQAAAVLRRCVDHAGVGAIGLAMARYHLASVLRRMGRVDEAEAERRAAAAMPRDLCFPNRHEDIAVLHEAIEHGVEDALAPYALGNLWYARGRRDEAIACWRESVRRDPSFPTAHRNLGLALFAAGDEDGAWEMYERAFALDQTDARVLYEFDQLAKRLRHDPEARLARLDQHPAVVERRDDLSIERIALLNRLGRHREALDAVLSRSFRPWEGGEGRVPAQFVFATCRLAERHIAAGRYAEAIELLEQTDPWPECLGEGKLAGIQENDIHSLMGAALLGLGRETEARAWLERASSGLSEPSSPMFYNDQPPEMIFFQGLALRALGRDDEARDRFDRLVAYGDKHMDDEIEIDYFAVSLPDFLIFEPDLNERNRAHCSLMRAFGLIGLGCHADAAGWIERVLEIDPANQWAAALRRGGPAAVFECPRQPAAAQTR